MSKNLVTRVIPAANLLFDIVMGVLILVSLLLLLLGVPDMPAPWLEDDEMHIFGLLSSIALVGFMGIFYSLPVLVISGIVWMVRQNKMSPQSESERKNFVTATLTVGCSAVVLYLGVMSFYLFS